jgi:putative lipase involved disintegration of autophagic bodies
VVFRGTTSFQDWLTDIQDELVSYPLCVGCSVHRGFYEAQQSIIHQTITVVNQLRTEFPDFQVVVTGHSLGK